MPRTPAVPLIQSLIIHGLVVVALAIGFYQKDSHTITELPIPIENVSGNQKPTLMPKLQPKENSPNESLQSLQPSVNSNELQNYLAMLVSRINETKSYPNDAKRHGDEGEVLLRIEIAASGQVLQAEIEKTSQLKSLDESALQAIHQLGQLPKLPLNQNGQAMDHSLILHIPVEFHLR
jgi:protein TonB